MQFVICINSQSPDIIPRIIPEIDTIRSTLVRIDKKVVYFQFILNFLIKYQNICILRHFIVVIFTSNGDWSILQRLRLLIVSINVYLPCSIIKNNKDIPQVADIIIRVAFIVFLCVWGNYISLFHCRRWKKLSGHNVAHHREELLWWHQIRK